MVHVNELSDMNRLMEKDAKKLHLNTLNYNRKLENVIYSTLQFLLMNVVNKGHLKLSHKLAFNHFKINDLLSLIKISIKSLRMRTSFLLFRRSKSSKTHQCRNICINILLPSFICRLFSLSTCKTDQNLTSINYVDFRLLDQFNLFFFLPFSTLAFSFFFLFLLLQNPLIKI